MNDEATNGEEIVVKGLPASNGIILGKATVYRRKSPVIRSDTIDTDRVEFHIDQFEKAREKAAAELARMSEKEMDESTSEIINAQIEMVNDPELGKRVKNLISDELHTVDYAIHRVFKDYLSILEQAGNKRAKERVPDISDIRDRLIQLASNQKAGEDIPENTVIIAREVSPREVIRFSEKKIAGLVTDSGGPTSHAAIIARSMGIPAVVGAHQASKIVKDQDEVAVDGENGLVFINPGEKTRENVREKIIQREKVLEELQSISEKPAVTRDGREFILRANIEFEQEIESLRKYRAEGIGLLRTESIYLEKQHFEDHQKQKTFYKAIVEGAGRYPVTIRLFDAGGDKFFNIGGSESNPFLGWRGIRMLLDEPKLLEEQLKAILEVAGEHPRQVQLLVPMISDLDEILKLKETIYQVQAKLIKSGLPVDENVKLGIMVEVPSVVVMAPVFARHVDFFSIGTNDLTQYALAADRGNELISRLYNQHHPAVWKMIHKVVTAGMQEKIEVAVCGELAADPVSAACLLGMGVHELSMSPTALPVVKSELIGHTHEEMKILAEKVLECTTLQEVEELFSGWKSKKN